MGERLHGLPVDEGTSLTHFDQDRAPSAVPDVAQHAFSRQLEVGLRVLGETEKDFRKQGGVHGWLGKEPSAMRGSSVHAVGSAGQSHDQMRRSQAGARVAEGR